MASVKVNQKYLKELRDDFMRRVDAGALIVQNEMVRLLTLNDGASMASVTSRSTGRRRKKLRYGTRRSSRGESPYKQSGQLSQSVAVERRPQELKCRIGDGVLYGSILENKMDRPHMKLALENKESDLRRLF